MIELTNSISQVISPGHSVQFDTINLHTGKGEYYKPGSDSVKLRAIGGIYEIGFSANVAPTYSSNPIALSIYSGDHTSLHSPMKMEIGMAMYNNVAKTIFIENTEQLSISVRNIGAYDIDMDSFPTLTIKRVS